MERTATGTFMASTTPLAQVVARTWARDSHDLFDFEGHQFHTQSFIAQRSMRYVRDGTVVQMIPDDQEPAPGNDPLLRLVQTDGIFWVDKASHWKKLWLVVGDLATGGHTLSESDVIKLGRFKFRVRQLVASACGGGQPQLRLHGQDSVCCVPCESKAKDLQNTMCRICLLEGSTYDDPLITPCKCKGSIEYVHLGCLRQWIRGRMNLPEAPTGSYFYRPPLCELCNSAYPTQIIAGYERVPLLETPPIQPPYVVLEKVVGDSHQHTRSGLYVMSLADKAIKLGRGHESDVVIADTSSARSPSISRHHATIRFVQGQFILEDNNSKFGTLVALDMPWLLDAKNLTSIQIGRTVMSLSLRLPPRKAKPTLPFCQLFRSNEQDSHTLRLSLPSRGDVVGGPGELLSGDQPPSSDTGDHETTLRESQPV